MDNQLFQKACSLIKAADNILVATHDHPDGDAIASACLMTEVLTLLNKKFWLYCPGQINQLGDFLPHLEKFKNYCENFDFDLIIVLDCGSIERTKLEKEIIGRQANQMLLEIDHHPKVENRADLEIRDPAAAATAEILYYFLKANRIKINKNLANCVLSGILTDTANFLYPSTSPQTINIASEMLKRSARLPQIMKNTWRNKSIASMKTWGKALTRLKINRQYNFGWTVLENQDVPAEITEEELEGMAGFLSNLNGVNAVMLLRELPDGRIKGSLRATKPNLNVARLATVLGGGGHAKAAGFIIEGKLEKTEEGWRIV